MDLQVLHEELAQPLPIYLSAANQPEINADELDVTAQKLIDAKNPALLLGWCAVDTSEKVIALADVLAAPVCTSLAGNGAFPAGHLLHAGLITNPSVRNALKDCDCLLAIGINSSELEYLELPEQVIHLDPAATASLLYKLQELQPKPSRNLALEKSIIKGKADLKEDWLEHNSKGRVNPAVFFDSISKALSNEVIVVTGHGTHRTLAAELLPINNPRGFIGPTSFNAMGYCVPAVNAIKLANPDKQVIGIVGDGAMVINGMEAVTAVREKLGAIYCLFNNSERTASKNLGHINWGSFAEALECGYFPIVNNQGIDTIVRRAMETAAQSQPVIMEVCIDYSRKTYYAEHLEKAQQARLPSRDKLELVKRAIVRKIMGSVRQKDSV